MFTISSMKIKLFGQTHTVWRGFKDGELVRVFEDGESEARTWIAKQ